MGPASTGNTMNIEEAKYKEDSLNNDILNLKTLRKLLDIDLHAKTIAVPVEFKWRSNKNGMPTLTYDGSYLISKDVEKFFEDMNKKVTVYLALCDSFADKHGMDKQEFLRLTRTDRDVPVESSCPDCGYPSSYDCDCDK